MGNEWRSLPASTKQSWEERAARCNEETSARLAEEVREMAQHVSNVASFICPEVLARFSYLKYFTSLLWKN